MSFDLKILGDKIRRYRHQFELSHSELAEETGLQKEDLIKMEAGELEPSGDQILILADFFKCDYRFFISNERVAPFEETETLFRMHGGSLSASDRWAIQEFLFLCECEEFLTNEKGTQLVY